MASRWYRKVDDAEVGPVAFQDLVELIVAGTLTADDWVRRELSPEWIRARAVIGLFQAAEKTRCASHVENAPSTPPPETSSVPEGAAAPAVRRRRKFWRPPLRYCILGAAAVLLLAVGLYLWWTGSARRFPEHRLFGARQAAPSHPLTVAYPAPPAKYPRAANAPPTRSFRYKKTKQGDLEIIVDYPPGWKETDKRAALVFFFGGGPHGSVEQFEPQAVHLAGRGMVAARPDYRIRSARRSGATAKECVEDAKSAVRWLRQNAEKMGIDPERIVASGGSTGAHFAACAALTPGLDAEGDDMAVSSKPNALVLFNPFLRLDLRALPFLGSDEAMAKRISPTQYLKKDSPPTLILFGGADPVATMGDEFMKKSKELGHRAELFTAEGQKHGFFNHPPWLAKTMHRMDEFLLSLGYLQARPANKTR